MSDTCDICGTEMIRFVFVVVFDPARYWLKTGPGRLMSQAVNLSTVHGYQVATCGDIVCRLRGTRHGEPGRKYSSGSDVVDRWISENESNIV